MNSAALSASALGVCQDFLDQLLDLLAGDRRDLELRLLGVGEEVRILHRVHERLAQRLGAVVRHAGRRQKGPPHHLPREDQLEDLLLVLGLGEIHDQRNVGQVRDACRATSCTSTVIDLSSIQRLCVASTLDHDQPQRPFTSPRSMAMVTSLPPG